MTTHSLARHVASRPPSSGRARRRTWALVTGLLGMALAVAGCSGAADDDASDPTASGSSPSVPATPTDPAPSASPATPTADESAETSSIRATCPVGLPTGVDPRACGPVPAEAVEFAPDARYDGEWEFFGSFVLPSTNIGCDLLSNGGADSVGVTCTIEDYDFTPAPVSQQCLEAEIAWAGFDTLLGTDAEVGNCRGDVLNVSHALRNEGIDESGAQTRVLEHGSLVSQSDIACLSDPDGVTCWNGGTGHGFRLTREAQLTW